jgi:asparagine synthase (glutamine-hydrolysing)
VTQASTPISLRQNVCGICGVFQVEGERRPVLAPGVLDRMTDSMTHRGPDDRGTYEAPGAAIGARRLSVIDVVHGHQPFANERRTVWAAQNGELYNHRAIRADLESVGHSIQTGCDTEIIPHLYEKHGVDFPTRLRGMFGIALWDEEQRRGVLVRDRLGVKPLYYAHVGDLVLYGSELKAVLASGLVATALDYDAIDAYLSLGFFPAPSTPLAAVKKLLPGERLVVDSAGCRTDRYWTYPRPSRVAMSRDDAVEGLREQLSRSIDLRLMSDVPLGVMLSGGIDSSVIVALTAGRTSEPVRTFSVGFRGTETASELDDARHVAERFGCDHTELELSLEDRNVDLEDLVWHLDEPLADLSSVGFLALSELAAQHVTVALSGQGADELLGGYRRHANIASLMRWSRVPGSIRSLAPRVLGSRSSRLARVARIVGEADAATRYLLTAEMLSRQERGRLAVGPLAAIRGDAAQKAVSQLAAGELTALEQTLYLDAQLALPDDMLQYFDRTSMAHSLEVRVPFLDHELVEYAATIPAELKVHRGITKYVLKELAADLIPSRIVDKPKVGFFNAAIDTWFRSQADAAVSQYLLSQSPHVGEFLDASRLRELVARQRAGGSARLGQFLLAVLMLEVWLTSYLPRSTSSTAPTLTRVAV